MKEAQIHDSLIAFLRKEKLSYVHHRMDRKSGIAEGWPDFTICHVGRCRLIEIKTRAGKLSEAQGRVIAQIRANGTPVTVARSVEEAIADVRGWLGVESPSEPVAPVKTQTDGWVDVIRAGRHPTPEPPRQFIGNINGKDYVLIGDSRPGGQATLLRAATAADLINIQRQ